MSFKPVVRRQTVDTFFVHNCFGSFFSGVLDWFGDEFYQRFNYKVIGTYDKAVKFLNDRKQMGVDPNGQILPAISLDPMLDFSNEERGGRFLWQHRTLAPGIGMRMFKSIDLKEQDILVTPVFSRYQGTFEVTFWLSSVYELIDFRLALLQFCGGFNRWIRPEYFWTYLILPDAIENFTDEDGNKVDWSNTMAEIIHIDTINKHKLGHPIALDPIWRLDSFADASTKYGGDQIAEYKLTASFSYEVNVPTYLTLSRGIDPKISLSFSIGKTYTKYPLVSPFKILTEVSKIDKTESYVSEKFKLFTFTDTDLARESLEITFSDNSVSYPKIVPDRNYIVTGPITEISSEWINNPMNTVTKDMILYFPSYKSQYLPAIRKCQAVISKLDSESSDVYQKCILLKKPFLGYLTDIEVNTIRNLNTETVTLDVLNRKLYSGRLEVQESDPNDPTTGYETIVQLRNDNPDLYRIAVKNSEESELSNIVGVNQGGIEYSDKLSKQMIFSKCNGLQTQFELGFILDDAQVNRLLVYIDDSLKHASTDYTIINKTIISFVIAPPKESTIYIGGQTMVIRDSKLIAIYEFSEDDVTNDISIIKVTLPEKIDRQEDLVVVSYCGKLEYGKDYILESDNITVNILIKPVKDDIVQFFYFV
jgi:hypothetical protein